MSIDIADQAFAIEETSKYVCDLDPHILKKAMTSLLGHPDPEVRKAVSQEMAKASAITENVNLDARKSPSEIAAEEKQDDEEHMSDAVPTDFEGEEQDVAEDGQEQPPGYHVREPLKALVSKIEPGMIKKAMIALAIHHDPNVRLAVHRELVLADAWFCGATGITRVINVPRDPNQGV